MWNLTLDEKVKNKRHRTCHHTYALALRTCTAFQRGGYGSKCNFSPETATSAAAVYSYIVLHIPIISVFRLRTTCIKIDNVVFNNERRRAVECIHIHTRTPRGRSIDIDRQTPPSAAVCAAIGWRRRRLSPVLARRKESEKVTRTKMLPGIGKSL